MSRLSSRFALFLAPSFIQGAAAFLVLPLATLVLDPSDYGVFALVSSISAFAASLSSAAGGLLLPAHYSGRSAAERARLVSAVLVCSLAFMALCALVVAASWPLLTRSVEALQAVQAEWLALSLLAALCSVPWSLAMLVMILEARPHAYAVVTIGATLVSTLTLLVLLFVFDVHTVALFWAAVLAGSVQLAGSLFVLRGHLRVDGIGYWSRRVVRITFLSAPANSLEIAQTLAERVLLGAATGPHGVGIYAHAQQYRNMMYSPLTALSNSIWPKSLEEGREAKRHFTTTGRVWDGAFIIIAFVGVFFACLGEEFIALFTHGKFTEAWPFASALMIVALVQFSGKPQQSVLYVNDQGEYLAKVLGIAAALGIACLFALVPTIGLWGAMLAIFVQQSTYRVGVQLRARRFGHAPFQDRTALVGIFTIGCGLALSVGLRPPIEVKILQWLLLSGLLLASGRQTVRYALRRLLGQRLTGA